MPRIPDDLLDIVIYLYPSMQDARDGARFGGSGFLVGIRSERYPDDNAKVHNYAVTNSHVIREGHSPIVRLNTQDGGTEILELNEGDWVHHPDADDVAICQVEISVDTLHVRRISPSIFLTKELITDHAIGPGDETFFLGRFISHDGKQQNLPILRFGNIAMMPWQPVRHPRGINQESFLIEARSLSGFSGSPVFLFTAPWYPRPGQWGASNPRSVSPWN
ncbi:MAG: trypsin-like peptidase domain-containing protein [Chloroflexi bacterium]|nr:trypsin-like peptidase domain-containing protein [Chloroflexota bacterium]